MLDVNVVGPTSLMTTADELDAFSILIEMRLILILLMLQSCFGAISLAFSITQACYISHKTPLSIPVSPIIRPLRCFTYRDVIRKFYEAIIDIQLVSLTAESC